MLRTVEPVSRAIAADGSLYFTDTVPADQHTAEIYKLIRVDSSSGRVSATRRFASGVDQTLIAGGSLWVTTSAESQTNQTTLWQLDPHSLDLRSRVNLPTAGDVQDQTGSLAVAGGHLWVGTGTLDRVSLADGRVDRVVHLDPAGSVGVSASASGRTLLATLGYENHTYIDRLNPVTGAVLSHTKGPRSQTQPWIAGVAAGGAWINNAVGDGSDAWRVATNTLTRTRLSGWAIHSGRVFVQVIDGTLWVTERVGENNLNYCANPANGHMLARLPPLPGDSVFLTADRTDIYYSYVPVNARSARIIRAPISRRCGPAQIG